MNAIEFLQEYRKQQAENMVLPQHLQSHFGLKVNDTIVKIYKGMFIVNQDQVIEVINTIRATRFVIDLDDSKMIGRRTSSGMNLEQQIKEAIKYIDWLDEVKKSKTA